MQTTIRWLLPLLFNCSINWETPVYIRWASSLFTIAFFSKCYCCFRFVSFFFCFDFCLFLFFCFDVCLISCLKLESYWSYEICFNQHVRQYHDEKVFLFLAAPRIFNSMFGSFFFLHRTPHLLGNDEIRLTRARTSRQLSTFLVEGQR